MKAQKKYKVLFVHNKYGIYSGEEAMIKKISEILSENGHEVCFYYKDSSTISDIKTKFFAFFSAIYSQKSKKELKLIISSFQPDIVQIQNLYPLISPSILPMLESMNIPVVMRLSNYRLICPNGLFLSHGKLCESCKDGKEYYCVLKNCEKNILKSINYALRNAVARKFGFYKKNVTRYYSQTDFQRKLISSGGYNIDSIDLIPNTAPLPTSGVTPSVGDFVGFVGRMSSEKGIEVFLDAARQCPDILFKVAGNQGEYDKTHNIPDNVILMGHLDRDSLNVFYEQCKFIVVPSICYEGFPGVIIEAMSHSKPVIASNIGGLIEIVEHQKNGLIFKTGNSESLKNAIQSLWSDNIKVVVFGHSGYKKVKENYNEKLYYDRLISSYRKAIDDIKRTRK